MSYAKKLMEMGAGRSWTTEDDKKLKYAVKKVAARKGGHIKDWEKVALIVGKRGDLCKDRWQNVVSPDIKKGAWSKEEDQRLLNASASCGSNMLNTMLDVFNSSSVDGKIRTLHQCQARLQQLLNGNHSRKLEEKSVEQGNIAGLYQQKAEGVGDEGVADEGVVDEGVAYAQVADALTLLQNNYNGEEELEIGDGLTNLFKTYAEADAASGIAVHNECKLKFLELKTKRTYRSIVFKIEEKQKQVIVEATGDPTETYEAFTDSLPTDECCYAVFDFDLPIPEGVPKRQILFIAWLPDTSREENKKIYASALDSFKRELDGIQIELEVTGPSEIGLDVIRNRAAKHEP